MPSDSHFRKPNTSRKGKRSYNMLFLIMFLMAVVALWHYWDEHLLAPMNNVTSGAAATATTTPRPKKVFVDLGANCGNSYLRIKQSPRSFLTDEWQIYLWEANPQLVEWFLNDLVRTDSNRNIHVMDAAAATKDDATLQFHLTEGQDFFETREDMMAKSPNPHCDPNLRPQPGGASTLVDGAKRAGKTITVRGIDFAKWLQELRLDFDAGDELALKIDIEGFELPLMKRMLQSEFHEICHVSQFMMETHVHIFPRGSPQRAEHANYFRQQFPMDYQNKCGHPPKITRWH